MQIEDFVWLEEVQEKLAAKHHVTVPEVEQIFWSEPHVRSASTMDATKMPDPIPEFETLEEIAEFWDAHSTADYGDMSEEIPMHVLRRESAPTVLLLPELHKTIEALARRRGVSAETLVNVWLTEKVRELA